MHRFRWVVSSNLGGVSNPRARRLFDRVTPLVGTIRQTNPAAAKASATRGASSVKEIAQLSVAYVKQETKAPLRGIGRFLGFGLAAAVFLGIGAVLLTLALLRGLQTALSYEHVKRPPEGMVRDRGPLSGSLSWLPYLLTAAGAMVLISLAAWSWSRDSRRTNR